MFSPPASLHASLGVSPALIFALTARPRIRTRVDKDKESRLPWPQGDSQANCFSSSLCLGPLPSLPSVRLRVMAPDPPTSSSSSSSSSPFSLSSHPLGWSLAGPFHATSSPCPTYPVATDQVLDILDSFKHCSKKFNDQSPEFFVDFFNIFEFYLNHCPALLLHPLFIFPASCTLLCTLFV